MDGEVSTLPMFFWKLIGSLAVLLIFKKIMETYLGRTRREPGPALQPQSPNANRQTGPAGQPAPSTPGSTPSKPQPKSPYLPSANERQELLEKRKQELLEKARKNFLEKQQPTPVAAPETIVTPTPAPTPSQKPLETITTLPTPTIVTTPVKAVQTEKPTAAKPVPYAPATPEKQPENPLSQSGTPLRSSSSSLSASGTRRKTPDESDVGLCLATGEVVSVKDRVIEEDPKEVKRQKALEAFMSRSTPASPVADK